MRELSATSNTFPSSGNHIAGQQSLSDVTIIERVRNGDSAAFELIMRRYNQRMFRIVRSILDDDDEAADVVQEVFVRAYERLHQFEERALFSTWLTRLAINEAGARRRKRQRVCSLDVNGHDHTLIAQVRPNTEGIMRQELNSVLSNAIEQLPDDLRTVFVMRVVEDLDTQDTADCLQLSAANVRTRLHRARMQLRLIIDREIGKEARLLYLFDGWRCDQIVDRVLQRVRSISAG